MLDLKKLIEGAVDSVAFDTVIGHEGLSDDIKSGTARVTGEVRDHSGFITLNGTVKPEFTAVCGRCGKHFVYSVPIALYAKITDKLANDDEDEFVIMTDDSIDIDDIARSALVLELPLRFLCKNDCRGLCPKCGADLNIAQCSCDLKDHDHRWDALLGYFDEE